MDCGRGETHIGGVPGALLTQRALICVFDLHSLLELVEFVDFLRALGDKLDLLLWGEFLVDCLIIDLDSGLLPHGAG